MSPILPKCAAISLKKIFFSLWIAYAVFADPYVDGIHYRYLGPTRALVEEGTFAIQMDREPAADAFEYQGRHFSSAAPALSVLAIPHYLIARTITQITGFNLSEIRDGDQFIFRILVLWGLIAPLAAYGGVVFFWLACRVAPSPSAALWWTAFFSFGTPQLFYAGQVYDYAIVSTCLVCALRHLIKSESAGALRHRLSAGAWLSLSYGLNYSSALAIIAISGVWFVRWRRSPEAITALIAGGCIAGIPIFLYHFFYFGGPFTTGYTLVDPGDFSSPATPAGGLLPWLTHQEWSRYPEKLRGLTIGIRGLFTHLPVALAWPMSLPFLFRARKKFPVWLLCAPICATLFFLLNLMMGHGIWQAGTSWGPRYMYPGLPFFVLCLAYVWNDRTAVFWKSIGMLSIIVNWIGIQYGNSTSLFSHMGYFFLSGPTTPFHRWFSTYAGPTLLKNDLATGLFPGFSGHYYALTQPSPIGAYFVLGLVLFIIWFNELRMLLGASRNPGDSAHR